MRTFRIRTAALATVTAALALGLTACGGADGSGSKAASAHLSIGTGTTQSRSTFDGDGRARAEATASGVTHQVTSESATVGTQPCRGDELLVTAVHRFAGQQGDHLLLTASNEGSKPCWVTSYPAVKLGDLDSPTLPHSKKDNPGGAKHLTLRPGGNKVYSAVNLFDYGSKHHTARAFALALRDTNGHVRPFYSVDVKGKKASWNEADVLNWNTAKPYDF